MWKEELTSARARFLPQPGIDVRLEFMQPCSSEEVSAVERQLGIIFPESLKTLLYESNGVMKMLSVDGGEWLEDCWAIWPSEEILQRNIWHRTKYADRAVDSLLFISSPGVGGVVFAAQALNIPHTDSSIIAWYPDESDVRIVGSTLMDFIVGNLSGATVY